MFDRLQTKVSRWIGIRQQDLSDHVHQPGDEFARKHGWTVATSTGRLGFGAREYRDPRFDRPSGRMSAGAVQADSRR
jgi:hypothetical protein